ncbi:MAG: hypothetical protein AAF211_25935 [Myxococcota bacterium]
MRLPPLSLAMIVPLVGCVDDLDPCLAEAYPISAALDPGTTRTGLYETVTAFEHADVERTHVYRADFGGSLTTPGDNRVIVRPMSGVHETPYNIVTRERDEVFVYGGTQGDREDAQGPFVARLDAETGAVVWRTNLRNTKEQGEFLWPGLVTAHGNGDLYAVYGTRLARLDPETGEREAELQLPTHSASAPQDTNFNGFTVLDSGVIVTKSFGRPEGCDEQGVDALTTCESEATPLPPSIVVSVDPEAMTVIDAVELDESSGGRLTRAAFEGRELVYVPGAETIFRFTVDNGQLELDEGWRVADYLKPGQTLASAPAILGDWVVFQTNANLSTAPLSVFAVAQGDDTMRLSVDPFTPGMPPISAIPSALTVDPDNRRIYPMDAGRGQIGCVELVDGERLEVRWVVDQVTINHTSLVGPPDARVLVATDSPDLLRVVLGPAETYDEQVVWRSAETGEELARSAPLPPMMQGDPLAPGFFGVWYYPQADGTMLQLEVESPELAECRSAADE